MEVTRTKHYFVADVHLGLRLPSDGGADREKAFVDWLDSIASDAAAIYLLGDVFDFWWEYKEVAPKGYVRVLGKLAHLADTGVAIHFFKGNHDRWTYGYLEKEIGMLVYDRPIVMQIGGARFCLGHGDGLGQKGILEKMFASRFLQRCFSAIHPRWGVALGHRWSARNRIKYQGLYRFNAETDPLYRFASTFPHPVDYFIFGHLHTSVNLTLPNKAQLIVLDEWMPDGYYAVFDTKEEDRLLLSNFV